MLIFQQNKLKIGASECLAFILCFFWDYAGDGLDNFLIPVQVLLFGEITSLFD